MIFNSRKIQIVTFVATLYILMAFGWWWLLLFRKNKENIYDKFEIVKLQMKAENTYIDDAQFRATPQYQTLIQKYDRQKKMIWGEGSLIFLSLLGGVWFINWSFKKEVALSNQRRNFLLSVTHELKSPIASIRLILQTFQRRKLDETQQTKFLNAAVVEADRLHELVDNLLLSSRLENHYEQSVEEINVAVMIEELIEKCHLKFPRAHFDFVKNAFDFESDCINRILKCGRRYNGSSIIKREGDLSLINKEII